jgi:hypothetical protein
MTVEVRAGDLFLAADVQALAYGCNCAGAMGAGIAVEFRRRWPAMFEGYWRRCRSGSFRLGDAFAWDAGEVVVYDLGTHQHWTTGTELRAALAPVAHGSQLHDDGARLAIRSWHSASCRTSHSGSRTSFRSAGRSRPRTRPSLPAGFRDEAHRARHPVCRAWVPRGCLRALRAAL